MNTKKKIVYASLGAAVVIALGAASATLKARLGDFERIKLGNPTHSPYIPPECMVELDTNFQGTAECLVHNSVVDHQFGPIPGNLDFQLPAVLSSYPGFTTDFYHHNEARHECAGGTNAGDRCSPTAAGCLGAGNPHFCCTGAGTGAGCPDEPFGVTCPSSTCNEVTQANNFRGKLASATSYGLDVREPGGAQAKPIVVLRFDDGIEGHYHEVVPLLDSRGLRATFGINTGLFGGDSPYCDATDGSPGAGDGVKSAIINSLRPENRMTEAQIKELHLRGFDMQSHSHNHSAFASYELWLVDWRDSRDWFWNKLRKTPSVYIVPGGVSSWEHAVQLSGWFQAVDSSTSGWNSPDGLMNTPDGGWRFMGGAVFPSSVVPATAAQLCNYIRQAVVPDDSAMLVLGFHCISDASEAIGDSANAYPEDEFVPLLDCLTSLRDRGDIRVMTYAEAVAARQNQAQPWNMVSNPGLGSITGSTTLAADWTVWPSGVTLAVTTDVGRHERQATFTQQAGTAEVLGQRAEGFIPGHTYTAAVDVEWVNNPGAETDRRTWWQIKYHEVHGDANGIGHVESPYFTGKECAGGANVGVRCAVDGDCPSSTCVIQANRRDTMFLEFVAAASDFDWTILAQGGSSGQQWIYRYPRIFKNFDIGGVDTNSNSLEHPGLVTFNVSDTFTANGSGTNGGNTDRNIKVLGNRSQYTLRGRGPSQLVITKVTTDVTAINSYSWSMNGRSGQNGTAYCSKTGLTADDAHWFAASGSNGSCPYQDNDANESYWTTDGTGDAGNEIHLRFSNSTATSESVTVVVQGYILR